MEMCITPSQAPTFEGLEKEEGNWIEIDQVELILRLGGCKISESSYMISLIERTRIRKINPINNKHFMDFVHIDSIRHRSRQTDVAIGMVIVFLLQHITQIVNVSKIIKHIL